MKQTTNGLVYSQLVSSPLDDVNWQKHRQELYQTLNSMGPLTGTATLSSGTVTISNSACLSTSLIFVTHQNNSATGTLSAVAGNGSFTIKSSNSGDNTVVAWWLKP
jgi:hypothetical protein